MQAISILRSSQAVAPPSQRTGVNWTVIAFSLIAVLSFFIALSAEAAGVGGVALKPAFDAINDIAGGYGKQLLVLVGFVTAAFAVLAANAASAILKFIGYIIFLAVGLTAALGLSGAVI